MKISHPKFAARCNAAVKGLDPAIVGFVPSAMGPTLVLKRSAFKQATLTSSDEDVYAVMDENNKIERPIQLKVREALTKHGCLCAGGHDMYYATAYE